MHTLRVLRNASSQHCCWGKRAISTGSAPGLVYPTPPSTHHHDLQSFLNYASRTQLDKTSTVYAGTHYEYTVSQSLSRLGITTRRTGAANDKGIDLLGTWSLPSLPPTHGPLRLFVQCKVLGARQAGPVLARELEGAFRGAPRGWDEDDVLGCLVTTGSGTKSLRAAMGRSERCMVYLCCSPEGRLLQMWWNGRSDGIGLRDLEVGQTYLPGGEKEIRLMWQGRNIMRA